MSDNLRLERIKVNKLFDRFNYDIDLNNGFDVGILIAPNGCGKTTIFNLIDFIFNPSIQGYRSIVNIPFDSCECTLSNGKVVTLKRETSQLEESKQGKEPKAILKREMSQIRRWRIGRILGNRTEEDVKFKLTIGDKREDTGGGYPFNFTETFYNSISDLIGNDPDDIVPDDLCDDIDLLKQPRPILLRLERVSKVLKQILQKNDCNLNVNYIRADRTYRSHESIVFPNETDPLSSIRFKILNLYRRAIKKYNDLQQKMKDDLPKMYLDKKDEDTLDFPTFQKRWGKYLSDVKKYCEIGLLPQQEQGGLLKMNKLKEAFEKKGTFLTVYLEAFAGKETLEPLEEFYNRLKLLADILNHRNRVTHKVLKYDFYTLNERGIFFEVDDKNDDKSDDKRLPLEGLSSGEKNDLIMFYHLIFDSYYDPKKKIDLVLVDEPEISLHITWQHEYIDRLLDICKLNDAQAFVATHSPDIVNGHFELLCEDPTDGRN